MKILPGAIMMLTLALTETLQAQVFPQVQNSSPMQKQMIEKYVADSQKVVDSWLALVDQGRYGESWDYGSPLFKSTISRKEWIDSMNALRKPLGGVMSRKIIDVGNADNPKGLPNGEYMVYYYKTEFASKGKNSELITLVLDSDGIWRVLTYQVL